MLTNAIDLIKCKFSRNIRNHLDDIAAHRLWVQTSKNGLPWIWVTIVLTLIAGYVHYAFSALGEQLLLADLATAWLGAWTVA